MVHTRKGSSYSVKPDGPGQGGGKTRKRSAKSFLRKTHLEDARPSPHFPRSVPTNFDVNSEPELIEGNVLRAEPLSSDSHRNISVPIQKLVQSRKRRGVGNMPQPLAGAMNSYLHKKSFMGQEKTIELLRGWSPLSCKDKKNELEMTPALEEGPVGSSSSKSAPEASKEKPKGPQKKKKRPKNHQGKGKGKANRHRPYAKA
ncbi:hypothetical protein O181_085233 [Austropuccinia psidii MF-1]|uniref:Uncharacterized protein n=1 Tax=Austropuccinia psidii MF-1 TaxID=1389203 RepID=A0A9Q3FX43_9BASI|nr:hypothetical protein [Austropuccinia psidii MF-1]